MDSIKNIITGGIITIFVGGAAFSFSQQDVIDNLASDTGLTAEQAEQYVNNIPEEDLASWDEIGAMYVSESELTRASANEIDCINYEYEWESNTLTCSQGKTQLVKIANTEKLLGQSYTKLSSDEATPDDMRTVIMYLNQLDSDYAHEVSLAVFGNAALEEIKMTNSYNKSLLKAALESN